MCLPAQSAHKFEGFFVKFLKKWMWIFSKSIPRKSFFRYFKTFETSFFLHIFFQKNLTSFCISYFTKIFSIYYFLFSLLFYHENCEKTFLLFFERMIFAPAKNGSFSPYLQGTGQPDGSLTSRQAKTLLPLQNHTWKSKQLEIFFDLWLKSFNKRFKEKQNFSRFFSIWSSKLSIYLAFFRKKS